MSYVNIGNSDDPAYRYKMPKLQSKTEGRGNGIKTILVNATDVATALHRPTSYLPKYFGYELGAQSKYDAKEDKSSVNGDHPNPDLIKILNKFIDEYVLCPNCHLPETVLVVKHKKDLLHRCAACGAESQIDANDKMNTFIINDMAKLSEDGKKKKKSKKTEEGGEEETKKKKKSKKSEEGGEEETKKKEKKHKHKEKKSTTSMFRECAGAILNSITPETTTEQLSDSIKNAQSTTSFSSSERASLGVYALLSYAKEWKEVPGVLEKYGSVIRSFVIKSSVEERIIVGVELLTFDIPSFRAYFPALLKFLYDADIINEDVIMKWNEKPLKHRFSCLTEKYIGELHEVAKPLTDWLMEAEGSEEEEELDMEHITDEAGEEGEEGEEEEGEEGEEEDDDDDDEEEEDDDE